jgi:hypothetical protein
MPDPTPTEYTPEDWSTGDKFTASEATEMSEQIDEEEEINKSQAATIAALSAAITILQNAVKLPYIVVTRDHGVVMGAGGNPVANSAALIAARTEAQSTGQPLWVPKGELKIQDTFETQDVSVHGPGGELTYFSKPTGTVLVIGRDMAVEGVGDRGALCYGFSADGKGTADLAVRFAASCIQNLYLPIKGKNATVGVEIDACQNNVFIGIDTKGCDTPWRIINDAATNIFIRCEFEEATDESFFMGNDNSRTGSGYGLERAGGFGPTDNKFWSCIFEYGTASTHLHGQRGQKNIFDGCVFAGFGNANIDYGLDFEANFVKNDFINCKFNYNADEMSGAVIRNAGFRNRIIDPKVNCPGLGTGKWVETSNNIHLIRPDMSAGRHTVEYTGAGDRLAIVFEPMPDEAYGTDFPDYGDVGLFDFYRTDLKRSFKHHPIDGWNDPLSQFDDNGGIFNIAAVDSATTFMDGRPQRTFRVTGNVASTFVRLPKTDIKAGYRLTGINAQSGGATGDVAIQTGGLDFGDWFPIVIPKGRSGTFVANIDEPHMPADWTLLIHAASFS